MLFNRVSYRRGVIEAVVIYTLGRIGALFTPTIFPDMWFVIMPLIFLIFMFMLPPVWAAKRMTSTKREKLSKRFWLLGLRLAGICFLIDVVLSLCAGLAIWGPFGGVQHGPALMRFSASGEAALTDVAFGLYLIKSGVLLFTFYIIGVICTRLANGGFLRFTMPAGGNRVTL